MPHLFAKRPWARAKPAEYRQLELRAHELLADVQIHDVWRVDLDRPQGSPERTIMDVRALMQGQNMRSVNPVVRALFAIRAALGQVFGWDSKETSHDETLLPKLQKEDRDRSLVEPGTQDGPFTVVYVHPDESISEIKNRTVHAFLVFKLQPHPDKYRLYWAVYVQPVGRVTGIYMAVIDPFRRFLVYPAMLKRLHRAWQQAFGG